MTAAARNPDLSSTMQRCMYETKHSMFQHIIDQAVTRGELCCGTDAEILHEVLHCMVMSRRMMEMGSLDAAYAEHMVDKVLIPVLEHASHSAETVPSQA